MLLSFSWSYTTMCCAVNTCLLHRATCRMNVLIQGGPKNWHNYFFALTLPNINRFSQLFHCQNQEKICNNAVTKDPTTPQVCRYTTLWNVKCLKSNNQNNTTSVTTHFKKLTTGNEVFIAQLLSKVTVTFCSFYIKCSVYPPCCWKTRSSRRRHWSMPRSVASPAWMRRPAARRTHWTFDVKTAECDSYFRQ